MTQLPNKEVKAEQLSANNLLDEKRIGNDSFVCSKHNPLVHSLYKRALKNYKSIASLAECLGVQKPFDVQLALAYGNNDKRFLTIGMTGPNCVRLVLRSFDVLEQGLNTVKLNVDEVPVMVKTLRTQEYCLTEPLENTLNWLKVFVSPMKNFHIFRLEDHITDVERALSYKFSSKDIAERLIKEVETLFEEHEELKEDLVTQCIFKHPEVLVFCEKQELMDDTGLLSPLESAKMLILQNVGSYFLMQRVLESIKEKTLRTDYDKWQMLDILSCMEQGLNFIDRFLRWSGLKVKRCSR